MKGNKSKNRINALYEGRKAFREKAWGDAFTHLSAADQEGNLEADDLDLFAKSAYLIGNTAGCTDLWARAHHEFLSQGDAELAIRCAFWLGLILIFQGEHARGGGWIARATRLLEEGEYNCVEQGYLMLPTALQCLGEGNAEKAYTLLEQAARIGQHFHDLDLMTLSRLGRGQALVKMSKISEGMAFLDDAMVTVEAEEVSQMVAGIVYCAVIETCMDIYDIGRAKEWTDALTDWCESQPDMVPFRGQCLIRRAEIMKMHGKWTDALAEARKATELLSRSKGDPSTGAAFYQIAELHRLRGNFEKAGEAYRQASKWGRKTQPGQSLLWLQMGQLDSAKSAISRALNESKNQKNRSELLPAYIDIKLATDNLPEARTAVGELRKIATVLDAPLLTAIASYAEGAVLLANHDDTSNAMDKLRQAWEIFEKLEAPYHSAKTRLLIALACRKLGDEETARMEIETGRSVLSQLEALPDLKQIDSLIQSNNSENMYGLTSRELQILRLVATGKTNKTIAADLYISERTVDRHVSNIFTKLNVPTRTAATAYAYKHNLI